MRYVLILLVIFTSVAFSFKPGRDYQLDEKSFNNEWLKMVEKKSGIKLPNGSRGLQMYYQGTTLDPSFIAKVEIPEDAHDGMVKQIEQLPNRRGITIGPLLSDKVTWWNPVKATIQLERRYEVDMNSVHVYFCKEKDRWVLYIMWMKI